MKKTAVLKQREVHLPHKPTRVAHWLTGLRTKGFSGPAGMLRASRELNTVYSETRFTGLPSALEGFVIAYASDIHFGVMLDSNRVEAWAERMNSLQADLMILGGDYGDDAQASQTFFSLCPPLQARLGVFGIWGNHDRAFEKAEVLNCSMASAGITPLVNEAVRFSVGGAALALCGADDYLYGERCLDTLSLQSADADFSILAVHEPDAVYDKAIQCPLEEKGFSLILCGHTHGGQVRIGRRAPKTSSMYGWRVGNRYLSGWYALGGQTRLLVSNGVGTTAFPLRLHAPAQIHSICLRGTATP